MAGKPKKQAADALTQLRGYLCRDLSAVKMVATVERYTGELRKERAALKSENERLASEIQSLSKKASELECKLASARECLDAESSRRRQAESDAAIQRSRLEQLEGKLSPPESPPECTLTERIMARLIKDVVRRMPIAPAPTGCVMFRGDRMNVLDLADFVPNFTEDEFICLGKFVVVSAASLECGVAFVFDKTDHRNHVRKISKDLRGSDRLAGLVHFMRNWIANPKEYEKKLCDKQQITHDIVSGKYVEIPKGAIDL